MESFEEYVDGLENERIELMQQFAMSWCSTLDINGNYIDDRMKRIVELENLLYPDSLAEWFYFRRRFVIDDILQDLGNELCGTG